MTLFRVESYNPRYMTTTLVGPFFENIADAQDYKKELEEDPENSGLTFKIEQYEDTDDRKN